MTIDSKIFHVTDTSIPITSIGGAVSFGSNAVKKIFPQCNIKVFTIGVPRYLELFKNVSIVDQNKNNEKEINLTHFTLDYSGVNRRFTLNHFPEGYIQPPIDKNSKKTIDIIFILPVYKEILESTVIKSRGIYPTAKIYCDPQGWLREKIGSNRIIQTKWVPERKLLDSLNVIKFSLEDLSAFSQSELTQLVKRIIVHRIIVIITLGRKGSFVFNVSASLFCPVLVYKDVKDTTGAGDIFISLFGLFFNFENDLEYALVGSTVATGKMLHFKENYDKIDHEELEKEINEYRNKFHSYSLQEGITKLFSLS